MKGTYAYNERAKGELPQLGVYEGDVRWRNGSDESHFHGQVEALVFPTFDVRQQCDEITHRDGNASIMELEAASEGSEDRLVLKQRELHANTDPGTFREGEEATPSTAHLVRRREPTLSRCTVLGFGGITAAGEPARRAEGVGVAEDGLIAVDADRWNVNHLALLDRDRLDP